MKFENNCNCIQHKDTSLFWYSANIGRKWIRFLPVYGNGNEGTKIKIKIETEKGKRILLQIQKDNEKCCVDPTDRDFVDFWN
jgi:hypothetical protein